MKRMIYSADFGGCEKGYPSRVATIAPRIFSIPFVLPFFVFFVPQGNTCAARGAW
jgi:hypothetical protein